MGLRAHLSNLKPYRDIYISLAIALLAYTLFFWNPTPLRHIESTLLDWHYLIRGDQPVTDSPIALVMVDNQSLEKVGRWPWPRKTIAQLSDRILQQHQAKTLALDIIFSEPTHNATQEIIDWMKSEHIPVPDQLTQRVVLDDDFILATLLKQSPSIVQGLFFKVSGSDNPAESDISQNIKQLNRCLFDSVNTTSSQNKLIEASELTINIPELLPSPGGCGFLNFMPDVDGAIRFAPAIINYQGFYLPSLALAALRNWYGMPDLEAQISDAQISIGMGAHNWQLPYTGMLWPIFQGKTETIPTFSAVDIMTNKVSPGTFKGKLVFVGVSAAGVDDIRPTSVDSIMPGTEIQAQLAYALLKNQILLRPDSLLLTEFFLILAIGIGYGLFFRKVIERSNGFATILIAILAVIASHWLFLQGIWMHLVILLLQLMLTFGILFILYYAESLKRRARLREVFSTYIDPAVVDEALKDEDGEVMLGGQDREISVMFMDVAGFTALSEKLTPQDVVHSINQFYDAATPIVQKYDGCIDRLMGDGMICLFGTPLLRQDHAAKACQVALEMESALDVIRPTFEANNHPLSVRIGINSGTMTVGNMGSSQRVHYTFMGDSGNVAARLESLNKQYGSLHMIGESTWQQVKGLFTCREMDQVVLVGKTEPMRIFELLDHIEVYDQYEPLISDYTNALALYRAGDFHHACEAFAETHLRHQDRVSLRMSQRCKQLIQSPPENWQGVWILSQK